MTLAWLVWSAVAVLVFAGARWGVRTIERHYADRLEVLGVLVLGACVLAPFVVGSQLDVALPTRVLLAAAAGAGLFADRARA
jgi:hypothetical protein